MIFFSFDLSIPFKKYSYKIDADKHYGYGHFKVSKNKTFEWQLDHWGGSFKLLGFELAVHPFQSHGGITLGFDFLGLSFLFNFCDDRHWNNDEGRWMTDYEMEHEFDPKYPCDEAKNCAEGKPDAKV